jgi:DNA-directed RNA polymerase specialized sigma24 family protein
MALDWTQWVFNPDWMRKLDKLALYRFGQPGLAEEASTYVIERLSADDWAMCHSYSGRAKPETYLTTLTQNLLEEFARKRFGRPRPPEWLKREGELWVRLWKMVCLERQDIPAVIDKLCQNLERQQALVKHAITTIKARLPWCGDSAREIPADCLCKTEADPYPEIIDRDIEQQLDDHEWEEALQLLFSGLLNSEMLNTDESVSEDRPSNTLSPPQPNRDQIERLRSLLALTNEEQLLLKLVYQEGLKLKAIATALNIPSYQPGRLLKGIHQRIREALRACDMDFEGLNFHD